MLTRADRACLGKKANLPDKRVYKTDTSLCRDNPFIGQLRLSTCYPNSLVCLTSPVILTNRVLYIQKAGAILQTMLFVSGLARVCRNQPRVRPPATSAVSRLVQLEPVYDTPVDTNFPAKGKEGHKDWLTQARVVWCKGLVCQPLHGGAILRDMRRRGSAQEKAQQTPPIPPHM